MIGKQLRKKNGESAVATDVLPRPFKIPWKLCGLLGGLLGAWLAFTTVVSNQFTVNITVDDLPEPRAESGELCPEVPTTFSSITTVTNKTQFNNVYSIANDGDAILLQAGSNGDWGSVSLNRDFSDGDPVYIMGYNPAVGGIHDAEFTDLRFTVDADNHVIAGIKITASTDTTGALRVQDGAANIEYRCSDFTGANPSGAWVSTDSDAGNDGLIIKDNVVRGIAGSFRFIGTQRPKQAFSGPPGDMPTDLHVAYNHFIGPAGASGVAAFRFGIQWDFPGTDGYIDAIIEKNTIENADGNSELFSVKADRLIIRNNCFLNNSSARLNLRGSHDTIVYGNWFENVLSGVTSHGKNNVIIYNYFRANGNGDFIRMDTAIQNDPLDANYPWWAYMPTDDNVIRGNVASGIDWMVNLLGFGNEEGAKIIPDSQPVGNVISDNHIYSNSLNGNNDSGSFIDNNEPGEQYTEAGFRAANTWGFNAITTSDLGATSCFDASHFNGPDITGTLGPTLHPDIAGEPIESLEPPWWD